ncbi:BQ5605_C013g07189 [Microbotryum silenes-dioicae]|uniref:BQ5605_C013g07189 protein n=1 Tax=Microbotryum silenes-dioicae TaxID=796604 RepID=A0A2X0LVS2_9BASI|nr:BQ5605_C013g07189 [Microbotryum silenes-dioicae]
MWSSTLASPFHASYALTPSLTSFASAVPRTLSPSVLKAWYLSSSTDPMHPALWFCTATSLIVWILGEVTGQGNVSQVDRYVLGPVLWTFLPVIYSAHFTLWPYFTGAAGGVISDRMLLVLILQLVWSARLTTNTYRRGFFNPKSEDYRWEVVRAKIPNWAFKILNLTFIAFMQNWLLLAAELPQYLLLTLHLSGNKTPALGLVDYALSAVFVAILAIEMLADNEQQRYQALKARAKGKDFSQRTQKEAAAIERGFVTGGLWSYSRHPNFACEQATWYVLYAFTILPFVSASSYSSILASSDLTELKNYGSKLASHIPYSKDHLLSHVEKLRVTNVLDEARRRYKTVYGLEGIYWNYAIWSPLLMSLLFFNSTLLTEAISAEKYPLYKQYQRRVSMFWPPLTTFKGLGLFVLGKKSKVEKDVFGIGSSGGKVKKL